MTTPFQGKRRHTRKGPPLSNHVNQTAGLEHVTTYNASGVPVSEAWNQRTAFYGQVAGVGALIQGNRVTPNPWKYDILENGFVKGKLDYSVGGTLQQRFEGYYGTQIFSRPFADWNALYNKGLDKLYDQVRGGLDLAVDIAEAGQAASMLRKSFKLVNLVRSIPELGPKIRQLQHAERAGTLGRESAFNLGKEVSNRWLEYQYGWKPLLSSIYGAADESIRLVLNKIQNFRVQATLPLPEPSDVNERDIILRSKDRYNVVAKHSVEYSINMRVPSWDPARWSSLNPASIAWELVPYSFVVDWFYDIGSSLRRMESALLYDKHFVSGYQSDFYYYFAAYQKQGLFDKQVGISGTFYGELSGTIRRVIFARYILSSMPGGHLPTIKADLGSSQLLSAAALLAQTLKPDFRGPNKRNR